MSHLTISREEKEKSQLYLDQSPLATLLTLMALTLTLAKKFQISNFIWVSDLR